MRDKNLHAKTRPKGWFIRGAPVFLLVLFSVLCFMMPVAFADDEGGDTSFYQMSSIGAAYLNDSFARDSMGVSVSEGSAGGLLGFCDSLEEGSVVTKWLHSAFSNSAISFSYDTFEKTSATNDNVIKTSNALLAYCKYGETLHLLGLDQTGAEGAHIMRLISGVLLEVMYTLALFVPKLFSGLTGILWELNPFRFFNYDSNLATIANLDYHVSASDGTSVVMQNTGGGLEAIAAVLTFTYDFLYENMTIVILTIAFVFLISSLIFSNDRAGFKKIKNYIKRACVMFLVVPFCAMLYTEGLGWLNESMELGTEYGLTRVMLSTLFDFETWAKTSQLASPGSNQADLSLDAVRNRTSSSALLNLRSTAYNINRAAWQKNGVYVTGSNADIIAIGQYDYLTDHDSGTNFASWNEDASAYTTKTPNNTSVIYDMLHRYIKGTFYYSSSFESDVKKDLVYDDGASGGVKGIIAATGTSVSKFKSEGEAFLSNSEDVIWGTPGRSGDLGTPGGNTDADGNITKYKSWDFSDSGGLSAMAMYNYLASTFDDSNVRVYSNEKSSSGFIRDNHFSVNLIGSSSLEQFLYWFNAFVLLGSVTVLGFFFAMAILFSNIKRSFLMFPEILTTTFGSFRAGSRLVGHSFLLIIETLVTAFCYMIGVEFLMSMTKIIEKPILSVITFSMSYSSGISYGSIVTVVLILSTICLIVFCIIALRTRKAIVKSIDEAVTSFIDRLFGVQHQPQPDTPSLGSRAAGALASGAGAGLASKFLGGGDGNDGSSVKGTVASEDGSGGGSDGKDGSSGGGSDGKDGSAGGGSGSEISAGDSVESNSTETNETDTEVDEDNDSMPGPGASDENDADVDTAASLSESDSLDGGNTSGGSGDAGGNGNTSGDGGPNGSGSSGGNNGGNNNGGGNGGNGGAEAAAGGVAVAAGAAAAANAADDDSGDGSDGADGSGDSAKEVAANGGADAAETSDNQSDDGSDDSGDGSDGSGGSDGTGSTDGSGGAEKNVKPNADKPGEKNSGSGDKQGGGKSGQGGSGGKKLNSAKKTTKPSDSKKQSGNSGDAGDGGQNSGSGDASVKPVTPSADAAKSKSQSGGGSTGNNQHAATEQKSGDSKASKAGGNVSGGSGNTGGADVSTGESTSGGSGGDVKNAQPVTNDNTGGANTGSSESGGGNASNLAANGGQGGANGGGQTGGGTGGGSNTGANGGSNSGGGSVSGNSGNSGDASDASGKPVASNDDSVRTASDSAPADASDATPNDSGSPAAEIDGNANVNRGGNGAPSGDGQNGQPGSVSGGPSGGSTGGGSNKSGGGSLNNQSSSTSGGSGTPAEQTGSQDSDVPAPRAVEGAEMPANQGGDNAPADAAPSAPQPVSSGDAPSGGNNGGGAGGNNGGGAGGNNGGGTGGNNGGGTGGNNGGGTGGNNGGGTGGNNGGGTGGNNGGGTPAPAPAPAPGGLAKGSPAGPVPGNNGGGQQPAPAPAPKAPGGGSGQRSTPAPAPKTTGGGTNQRAASNVSGGGQQPAPAPAPKAPNGGGQQPAPAPAPKAPNGGGQQPAPAPASKAPSSSGQKSTPAPASKAPSSGGQKQTGGISKRISNLTPAQRAALMTTASAFMQSSGNSVVKNFGNGFATVNQADMNRQLNSRKPESSVSTGRNDVTATEHEDKQHQAEETIRKNQEKAPKKPNQKPKKSAPTKQQKTLNGGQSRKVQPKPGNNNSENPPKSKPGSNDDSIDGWF